jgi:chloramphenicol 3-O-phosphotransferase
MTDGVRRGRVILIDGRSGSGKTALADAIAADHPAYRVVHLDDLYRGWNGLRAASELVPALLLGSPVRAWDWAADEASGPWLELDPQRPVLVEGCGAITRASRELADFGVWIELDAATRRERALLREPDFAPHWDAWARLEDAHIAAEAPDRLADVAILATPETDVRQWRSVLDAAMVVP